MITRENSGCTVVTQPSEAEKARARKSFINRARALLIFLGFDPTPDNVAKIQQDPNDPKKLSVNGKDYLVWDNEETLKELEILILTNPKLLPSKFLGLFLTGAFDKTLDFKTVMIVAEALRKDRSADSLWAIHRLIDFDKFIPQHIQEIIDHTGLKEILEIPSSGIKVDQVSFNGNNYVIQEIPREIKPVESHNDTSADNFKCFEISENLNGCAN